MRPDSTRQFVEKKDPDKKNIPSSILEAVNRASAYLKDLGVESHRLDSELIVAVALDLKRIDLYLMYDRPLAPEEFKEIGRLIVIRGEGTPTAYITGLKEFWSLDISVNESALIPRPETEVLVEEALSLIENSGEKHPTILEIGTGSGAVAIALTKQLPGANIKATDISQKALQVAEGNFKAHGVSDRVTPLLGSLYEPIATKEALFDLIVSNPPYISAEQMEILPVEVKREPSLALNGSVNGGEDGLDIIRGIVSGAPDYLKSGGYLALEIGSDQLAGVSEIIDSAPGLAFFRMRRDYASHPRVVIAVKE
jgi:release factor glutamine methyltransferase